MNIGFTENGIKAMAENNVEISEIETPPLSPSGEKAAPADSTFTYKCMETLHQLNPIGPVKAGNRSLTINNTFGKVFRVDFTINHPDTVFINRMMCWKTDAGILETMLAIGQKISPLGEK